MLKDPTKVNDIEYGRADISGAVDKLRGLTRGLSSADAADMIELRGRAMEITRVVSVAATLAEIRFAQNTADGIFLMGLKSCKKGT
jgi:hypothetical protein